MKILVLSNLYPPHYVGGYELYCRTAVEALRARGHSVEVLTSDHGLDKNPLPQNEPGIFRSLKIHGLFGHPWLGIYQLQRLERHNNQALISTIRRFRPDLVYAWSFNGLSKSMLFTLQKQGLPTVFSFCDHWLARSENSDVWISWWNKKKVSLKHRGLRSLWTISGRRRSCQKFAPTNPMRHLHLARLHFCSRALRDFNVNAGFDVKHGAVIYCPINLKRFQPPSPPVAQPMRRLLYVGRLHKDKGVMTALRAMTLVRDKFAGWLSLYGQGDADYVKELQDFIVQEKLPAAINSVSLPEQMPPVYASHDALLFTSEWPEPFAFTPLEAMASGLPTIATTTGGSAELFRHGENSLTYTAGNAEELAQRILELEKDAGLRQRIATAGFQEVSARFDEKIIMDQIETYLRETIDGWKPGEVLHYAA